ncbi:hypothetical protein DBR11_04175 [Pedobacter sp. HMWF019]|nr:hypothetical protein DBR11_04175 [Pedobacter sp. HMWF019]
MKLRNLLMAGVLMIAVTMSLALNATNKPPIIGSFQYNASGHILCMANAQVDADCSTVGTGPACTMFYLGTYNQEFVGVGTCVVPLFHQF